MEYILMSQSHVESIAELERICFTDPWSVNSIASELKNEISLWVVAVDSGKVVGYVGSQSVLGWADMMNLAVDPAYRKQGVGRALICNLINRLKANKVTCLTLEVRVSNEPAVSLYRSMGFTEVGRRPGYYHNPKEDALILRKEWDV